MLENIIYCLNAVGSVCVFIIFVYFIPFLCDSLLQDLQIDLLLRNQAYFQIVLSYYWFSHKAYISVILLPSRQILAINHLCGWLMTCTQIQYIWLGVVAVWISMICYQYCYFKSRWVHDSCAVYWIVFQGACLLSMLGRAREISQNWQFFKAIVMQK